LAGNDPVEIDTPIDAVLHLAQSSRFRDFVTEAYDIFAVNTGATSRLLELARRNGARHFVLASTGSVYSAANGPCREDSNVRPTDFYAATKLAAEVLLRPYTPYLRTCALRLFVPYGPGQRHRLIANLIEKIRTARPVTLDGEAGGLRLAVTYVDDVVATFVAAAEQGWEGVYNVASPEPTSVRDIATRAGRLLGTAPLFERTGRPEPVPLLPDLTQLATLCDVAAFTRLERGLAATLGF
jgi:nucleoside-diphosphate-sugar epimerase